MSLFVRDGPPPENAFYVFYLKHFWWVRTLLENQSIVFTVGKWQVFRIMTIHSVNDWQVHMSVLWSVRGNRCLWEGGWVFKDNH